MKKLEEYVRSIPDFPEPGIIFRDVTSILQDADGLKLAVDSMQALLEDTDADVIVGTESRGFIFGAPIAYKKVMIWNMEVQPLKCIKILLSQVRK